MARGLVHGFLLFLKNGVKAGELLTSLKDLHGTQGPNTQTYVGQNGDVEDIALWDLLPYGRAHADVTGFGPLEQKVGDETTIQRRAVAKPIVPTCGLLNSNY